MAVGNQPTPAGLSSILSALATGLRNDCRSITNFQEYVTAQGLTGLEALGFTPADAQQFITDASYLATVAGVFQGTVQQTPAFNFENQLALLYGGQ